MVQLTEMEQEGTQAFTNPNVAQVFASYPDGLKQKLMHLRQLIFLTAKNTPGVGELTETLKWGQPSYLTLASKSGSTIRLDCSKTSQQEYMLFFHCQTSLVETFRELYPDDFRYQGNRGLIFTVGEKVPRSALEDCIAMALTYHLSKKSGYGL